ncbi:C45 family autoproteolytic acyltransferase/hydolase [Nonomuraea jabiensis]|uniref:C45 family autoproteolytic acyltransferase/hydolase n=1 Tax=Nonomuraea jabiensis TaxID=882448 RepID=UPI003D70D7D4
MSINYHFSDERDPLARGRGIGERWRAQIHGTAKDYAWLFDAAKLDRHTVRRIAEQGYEHLRAWAPGLATEMEGVAQGTGLELWEVAALNCRTEILVRGSIAGLKECTAAAWLPPGEPPRALQTWDWIPSVGNFTVLRHTSPADLTVATFAENGVLGKAGVNSAGLGLLFTLLCHTSDGTREGVPIHAVARHVLDTARSVQDAVDIVRSAPLTASASFTVLTWDGRSSDGAVIEASPEEVVVLPPEEGFLLHTNHFLDPGLAKGDRLAAIGDDTLPRMDVLRERKSVMTAASRTEWAKGLVHHWEDGAPVCAHPRPGAPETDRWETKMLISFDLDRRRLVLQEGGPCAVTADGWTEVAV